MTDTDGRTFRDLSKPVGALTKARREYFAERHDCLKADYEDAVAAAGRSASSSTSSKGSAAGSAVGAVEPFHYGTHYSNIDPLLPALLTALLTALLQARTTPTSALCCTTCSASRYLFYY